MNNITSFNRVLIANRGEIALRAIRTSQALGLQTVAIYSVPDAKSPHVWAADRSVCIGPPAANESYLCSNSLIHIAKKTDCDAIYPGYGFLAESAHFASLCREHRIKFIGPSPETIEVMGDKARAREIAVDYDIPVVPGSETVFFDAGKALEEALAIGFPMLLKARLGGGGRGMRIVNDKREFISTFVQASREAVSAFGDGGIYLEKFFPEVRHVEVQVLGDGKGGAIVFDERDCSVQRRHQKLIEESPSPIIGGDIRSQLLELATRITKGISYEGAGTIEFIFDVKTRNFYFIEMNTRIQVEHPVTEMRSKVDLVKAQFEIAAGRNILNKVMEEPMGHAIEFRINAEDWNNDFTPSPGVLNLWQPPYGDGIRVDSSVYQGISISPYYDSMIAKLIIHGSTRAEVIKKARDAFSRFSCEGVKTTIDFHKMLLEHESFQKNHIHTRWIETELEAGKAEI